MYIACPKCDWRPTPDVLWVCTCGHRWHTFDTHGVCPACGKAWKETQCQSWQGCGKWSDHEDWYHEDDGLTVEEYLANPQHAVAPPTRPASG
ncbi:MAG: hypothetical protein GXY36_15045 [Chloroflexi bacterium]|jgi:hypothetical protein|nr:hypothetical protein [Chloroflexota bacterium]